MVTDKEVGEILFGIRPTQVEMAKPYIKDLYKLGGLPPPPVVLASSLKDLRRIAKSRWYRLTTGRPFSTGGPVRVEPCRGYKYGCRFRDVYYSLLCPDEYNAARMGVGFLFGTDKLAAITRGIFTHVGGLYMTRHMCVVIPRPIKVVTDDLGRPHSMTGPAIVYPHDSIYAVFGKRIPDDWIVNKRLCVAGARKIIDELMEPSEQIIIDNVGRDIYVPYAGNILSKDGFGTLWRVRLNRTQMATYVEVKNATIEDGVHRTFFLRVPPTMKTPHQAIAWTFGMKPNDYDLTLAA